jgi:hypothetical protein
LGRRPVQIGIAVAAVAVAAVAVAVLVLRDDDSAKGGPVAGSVAGLRALARTTGHPVYWAGERKGSTYELTRDRNGSTYVRYLPQGVALGDSRASFLTIGTYVEPNASAIVRRAARRNRVKAAKVRGGGVAVANPSKPDSVYIGYPSTGLLVEVFHPSPASARRLARSGRVVPVR